MASVKVRIKEKCFYKGCRRKPGQLMTVSEEDIKIYPFLEAVSATPQASEETETESEEEVSLTDAQKLKRIQEAVYSLSYDDDDAWTTQGLPQVSAVEDIIGFDILRADIKEACPGYTKDDAKK